MASRACSSVSGSPDAPAPPCAWPEAAASIHCIIGPPDCGSPHCTSQSYISPRCAACDVAMSYERVRSSSSSVLR